MKILKYKAFISYSHKDEAMARWLHRRLEHFTFPKGLVGTPTAVGPVPKSFKPVFRDREDLAAAGNLGEKIEQALSNSENLIIICSPDAAQSQWVNQEILFFKQHNNRARVFSIIIDGDPFAKDPAQECLPPALRFEVNRHGKLTDKPEEPLAADLRSSGDGRRLGILKLMSGLAGLDLDNLVQRDLKRARNRVTAITSVAAAIVLVMGSLTWIALDAKNEATQRRTEAENLIEFMIGDLKDKLEPVGRIDVLGGVADEVLDYYASYDRRTLGCDAIGRKARASHLAAEIAGTAGNIDNFSRHADNAYLATAPQINLCSDKASAIFDHAQSAFWKGYANLAQGKTDTTRTYFEQYHSLAEQLIDIVPTSTKNQNELAAAAANLGAFEYEQKRYETALAEMSYSNSIYTTLAKNEPENASLLNDHANVLGWLAKIYARLDNLDESIHYFEQEIFIAQKSITLDNENWDAHFMIGTAYRDLGRLSYLKHDFVTAEEQTLKSIQIFELLSEHDNDNSYWLKGLGLGQTLATEIYKKQNNIQKLQALQPDFQKTLEALEPTNETIDSLHKFLRLTSKSNNEKEKEITP